MGRENEIITWRTGTAEPIVVFDGTQSRPVDPRLLQFRLMAQGVKDEEIRTQFSCTVNQVQRTRQMFGILALTAQGATSERMSKKFYTTRNTIERQKAIICEMMGIEIGKGSLITLSVRAVKEGLVPPEILLTEHAVLGFASLANSEWEVLYAMANITDKACSDAVIAEALEIPERTVGFRVKRINPKLQSAGTHNAVAIFAAAQMLSGTDKSFRDRLSDKVKERIERRALISKINYKIDLFCMRKTH